MRNIKLKRKNWEDSIYCLACGMNNQIPYMKAKDPLGIYSDIFKIFRCHKCGSIKVNPKPDLGSLTKGYHYLYTEGYNESNYLKKLRNKLKTSWQIRNAKLEAAWLAERLHPGRLLDIGCGDGIFCEKMAALGWDCTGIDPWLRIINNKKGNNKCKYLNCSLADIPSKIKYDLIVFRAVLEHMSDPENSLFQAKKLLNKGGIIYITLPRADTLQLQVYRNRWYCLDPPRHLFLLSMQGMNLLLKKVGLIIFSNNYRSRRFDGMGIIYSILPEINRNIHFRCNIFDVSILYIMNMLSIILSMLIAPYSKIAGANLNVLVEKEKKYI